MAVIFTHIFVEEPVMGLKLYPRCCEQVECCGWYEGFSGHEAIAQQKHAQILLATAASPLQQIFRGIRFNMVQRLFCNLPFSG